MSFSVTTEPLVSPVSGAPSCPKSMWTETITDVSFTSAKVTVQQPPGTTVLTASCTFNRATSNGSVPSRTVTCGERLLVGLRPGHRLAGSEGVELAELADQVLGMPPEALFRAWAISQRQALEGAGVSPSVVELRDTDLSAVRWLDQADVDWILLIRSLAIEHVSTVVKPVAPLQLVRFSLLWNPRNAHNSAIAPFVQTSLTAPPRPPGWFTQPGHFRHGEVGQ